MPFAFALCLSFQPLGSPVRIPIFVFPGVFASLPAGNQHAATPREKNIWGHSGTAIPALPLPLPLRRRGLGMAPTGECRASRTAEGSQEEASDSPPSRSGLQGSSYIRRDGSESCFLRGQAASGSGRAPAGAEPGGRAHPLPLLPPAIARVPKALGEGVVIDFQLRYLPGERRRQGAL